MNKRTRHDLTGRLSGLTACLLLCSSITAHASDGAAPDRWLMTLNNDHLSPEQMQRVYRDLDGDHVIDDIDQCPNSPDPQSVNRFGCLGDQDRDGVSDALDLCPNTPEKVRVNEHGCPLDDDGDGVANYLDACPDTPTDAQVNSKGCRPVSKVMLHLNFPTGEYTLTPEDQRKIDEVLQKLPDLNEATALLIEGHTDNVGCDDDNESLSWNRAESVRAYIEAGLGDEAKNLYIIGYGPNKPIASNATADGRSQNRRIELKVVPVKKLPSEATFKIPDDLKGYTPHPGRCLSH